MCPVIFFVPEQFAMGVTPWFRDPFMQLQNASGIRLNTFWKLVSQLSIPYYFRGFTSL